MRVLAAVLVLMVGCDDASRLRSGDYELESWTLADGEVVDPVPEGSLVLDLEALEATLAIGEQEPVTLPLVLRPRRDHVEGCATNLGASRMEVAELDVGTLELDGHVLTEPHLVAECRDGLGVFLTDGVLAPGGYAASCGDDFGSCLYFL